MDKFRPMRANQSSQITGGSRAAKIFILVGWLEKHSINRYAIRLFEIDAA
jgi:hypothetical protein